MPEDAPEADLEDAGDEEEEKPAVDAASTPDLDAINDALGEEEEQEADAEAADEADEETGEPSAATAEDVDLGSVSNFGDAYVKGLCTVANAGVQKYGGEDATEIDPALAYDLELDTAMNDWMTEHGQPEEMSPGQQLLVMTAMFLAMVVALNPAIIDRILDKLGENDA